MTISHTKSWKNSSWVQQHLLNWRWVVATPVVLAAVSPVVIVVYLVHMGNVVAGWVSEGTDRLNRYIQYEWSLGKKVGDVLVRLNTWIKKDFKP